MDQSVELTVGKRLQTAREARGLTIEDIAAEITVPQHYLLSIEQDRFDALPGQTYAVGFVRNYSRYLNLPASDIIDALKQQFEFPKALDSHEIASGFVAPPRASVLPGFGSVFAGLSVVAAVYVFWTISADGDSTSALPPAFPGVEGAARTSPAITRTVVAAVQPNASVDAPDELQDSLQGANAEAIKVSNIAPPKDQFARSAQKTLVAQIKPAAARDPGLADVRQDGDTSNAGALAADDVAIHVLEESWIEVRTDSSVVFTGIKKPGDTITLPARTAQSARLTTGNAGGVWLSVGDWSSEIIGAPGRVRRNLDLAPQRLVAVLTAADRS